MASDGITDADRDDPEAEWLCRYLSESDTGRLSARQIASDILRQAQGKYGSRERDDLTVAAAVIVKGGTDGAEDEEKNPNAAMSEEDDTIYYACGETVSKIDMMPQVESIKEKNKEILYLTDYVDEFAITAIQEYDGKKFANVESEDLSLETEEEKDAIKKANEDNSELLKHMKEEIGDVSEVKFSNKLKKHPVCLTTKGDVSIEMQKVFDAMPNDMGIKAEKVLEINEKHQIAEKLKYLYENDKEEFDKYTKILYAEAKMIAGLPIENPTEISTLICEVISK